MSDRKRRTQHRRIVERSALIALASVALAACELSGVSHTRDQRHGVTQGGETASSGATTAVVTTTTADTGATSGTVSASAQVTQELTADAGSAIAGTAVQFPPGTMAIDTVITVQEAVPVATQSVAASLGIEGNLASAGLPVAIQPAAEVDPAAAFTVALSLPAAEGLRLDGLGLGDARERLVVIYKVRIYATGEVKVGVLPRSALTLDGEHLRFAASYFGVFQAAYAEKPVEAAVEVAALSPIQTKAEVAALPALEISARTPFVVRAGDRVELSGRAFRATLQLALAGKPVGELKVVSDVRASFVVPSGLAAGSATLTADQDGVAKTVSLLYTPAEADTPVITLPPASVCAGVTYYDQDGVQRQGSKTCAEAKADAKAACSRDGQTDCIANASYPAAQSSGLAAKVLSGNSVAGIAGVVSLPAAANVLAGVSFGPAANSLTGTLTLPVASKVRVGNGAYGVGGTGYVPTLPDCSGDGAVGCVTVATFPAAAKQGFGASDVKAGVTIGGVSGSLASCAADGATGCIATASFKAADTGALNPANLPVGIQVAGVTGTLRTNCRNVVKSTYNHDGLGGLTNTSTSVGTSMDPWDTSDDEQTLTPDFVAGWPAETVCDDSNFVDVTSGSCSPSTCVYKDRLTGLRFTAVQAGSRSWSTAVQYCDGLNYAGSTDWRLPTQKELMSLYEHGITSLSSTDLVDGGNLNQYFWTATHNSSDTTKAWAVYLSNGDVDNTHVMSYVFDRLICVQ